MKMRKITALILAAMLSLGSVSVAHADTYLPYTEQASKITYQQDTITMNFLGKTSRKVNIIYANGRLCVPLMDTITALGGTSKKISDSCLSITIGDKSKEISLTPTGTNKVVVCYSNGTAYISLYELLEPFGLMPIVSPADKKVNVLKTATKMPESDLTKTTSKKDGYIRLEDIVADGMDTKASPNYTLENLEKLRYTGEYLYTKGEEYYIAWIPVYSNPATGAWNDVSVTFNLYNAYFVYTLDYLLDHGGHIGLHGYTHQYGNDKSGVGFEWGADTPYTTQQQQQRMIYAKETANRLGYKEEFFEFPHYGATAEQLKMAEFYFDIIYQSYPDQTLMNQLTYTTQSNKKVYYIPTPADYVHNTGDLPGTIKRLTNSLDKNYTMSLFYHPAIDFKFITMANDGDSRMWYYSDKGILPSIISFMDQHDYKFTELKQK